MFEAKGRERRLDKQYIAAVNECVCVFVRELKEQSERDYQETVCAVGCVPLWVVKHSHTFYDFSACVCVCV